MPRSHTIFALATVTSIGLMTLPAMAETDLDAKSAAALATNILDRLGRILGAVLALPVHCEPYRRMVCDRDERPCGGSGRRHHPAVRQAQETVGRPRPSPGGPPDDLVRPPHRGVRGSPPGQAPDLVPLHEGDIIVVDA